MSWKRGVLEVLLIFLGITLAIWFENLNNYRIKLEQERTLYESLILDLRSDQSQISSTVQNLESDLNRTQNILSYLYTQKALSDILKIDSIFDEYFIILDFLPRTTTFDEMTSTGFIYDLEDKQMKEMISSFYLEVNRLKRNIIEENKELERDDAIVRDVQLLRVKYGGWSSFETYNEDDRAEVDWTWLNDPESPRFRELEKIIVGFHSLKEWEAGRLKLKGDRYDNLLTQLELKTDE